MNYYRLFHKGEGRITGLSAGNCSLVSFQLEVINMPIQYFLKCTTFMYSIILSTESKAIHSLAMNPTCVAFLFLCNVSLIINWIYTHTKKPFEFNTTAIILDLVMRRQTQDSEKNGPSLKVIGTMSINTSFHYCKGAARKRSPSYFFFERLLVFYKIVPGKALLCLEL